MENNKYSTPNTALAAYLKIQGFNIEEMRVEEYPVSFIFEDSPKLREYIRLWGLGRAEGNINVFFYAYKEIVKKVHLYNPTRAIVNNTKQKPAMPVNR